MYARMVLLNLGQGKRAKANELADQFAAALSGMQGFRGVTFLADETAGEYGSLSLWESRADAENVAHAADQEVRNALKGLLHGPPRIRLFEVYEPRP